ncbi:MAG: class II fructose-bisphosphate aldolase [Minisyncoccia bacterium]|jgi:ketose-bisphosphate aldolase
MKKLNEYFQKAKAEKWAIGHFNFSTEDQLKAFVEAAAELKSPIMVAVSEGEAKYFGRPQAAALVKSFQETGNPVYLNADHHKSWETIKDAIDAGFDTVLFDGSKLPYEENIALTKKVVTYAKKKDSDMMVEGELGYLRGDSQIQENVEISPADYTQPEQATDFVKKTGVDRLAIVFGNIHGIVTKQEEHLDIGLLKKIVTAVPDVYLVLHGASGLPPVEIKEAIANGITNVHINTELRVAYIDALKEAIQKDPKQTTPYKVFGDSYEATKKAIREKLELFGSVAGI